MKENLSTTLGRVFGGPHYRERCVRFNPQQKQIQGPHGSNSNNQNNENYQGFAAQNAQVKDWDPVSYGNRWVKEGYDNGTQDWGWASGSGETEGNSVTCSFSDLSEVQHLNSEAQHFDWSTSGSNTDQ